MKSYNASIYLRIMKKLDRAKNNSLNYIVIPAHNDKFEVIHWYENSIVVDLGNRSCMCGIWDLIGIPCYHACAVIFSHNKRPEYYVSDYFKLETFMKTYGHGIINPVPGPDHWPTIPCNLL